MHPLNPEIPPFEAVLSKVKSHSGAGRLPLVASWVNDLETSVSLYRRFEKEKHSFLLESVQGGEKWGRYSFIGLYPSVIFESAGDRIRVTEGRRKRTLSLKKLGHPDALESLKRLLQAYVPVGDDEESRFLGGAVGFVSYDMVRFFEKLPERAKDDRHVPDLAFMIPQILLAMDNLSMDLKIVYDLRFHTTDPRVLKKLYDEGVRLIQSVVKKIRQPKPDRPSSKKTALKWKESLGESGYKKAVETIKEYVMAGDVTQTVPSNRFEARADIASLDLYRAVRRVNPSPYLFHYKFAGMTLVGASPETMVRLENGEMSVRPIAGTRPRGKTDAQDEAFAKDLLADPKEVAEHVMLVDLGRNDLGRVAASGSVTVDELMTIERYSHVMHIVSNVKARLAEGRDMFDVLRATFPAGTLSGSAKVRAMQIIEELEPVRRGPYGGCVGYFGFNGNMDMAITIRSALLMRGKIYIQAGAGIVADSDPAAEYQEVRNKARAMIRSVEWVCS